MRKGLQFGADPHIARSRIMMFDECPNIVERYLGGRAAELNEGALHAF
ncbi:hypothetical protein KHC28_24185 [Ancylobacter sonchi]|nr:hypothetical protein [Ancylobacter sonchi]